MGNYTLDESSSIEAPSLQNGSSGLVTLKQLHYFSAHLFGRVMVQLMRFELNVESATDSVASAKNQEFARECASVAQSMSDMYRMTSTVQQCRRIAGMLGTEHDPAVTNRELRDHLRDLRLRIADDLDSHYFLHLEYAEGQLMNDPAKGWEDVLARFPKVRYNIEESGRCLALQRFGASVFHVLQVAEYGVIQVSNLMGVSGDKPGWGSLAKLQSILKEPYPHRSDLAKQHSKLLENVVPLAFVIKDSWRHKLDHVDNQIVWVDTDFSPMVAAEIISATRAFMRKLALDMPEEKRDAE